MNYQISKDSLNHLFKVTFTPIFYCLIRKIKFQHEFEVVISFLDLRKCIAQHCNYKSKEKVLSPLSPDCITFS